MNLALLISLAGFALVTSITPGPNNLLLMSSGALFGWQRSLPHLGGILLGFAILMTSAVFGLGSLVARWPWLLTIVKVVGAGWLAWMSLRYFLAAVRGPGDDRQNRPAPLSRPFRFYEGVLFQWVNPKALILVISAAGAYITIADSLLQRALIMVGVFFLSGLVSCSLWMFAGELLHRLMSAGKAAGVINLAMGVLILATALYILLG
ncbi:MAG: LysE family translocator [Woeseiaceae bacterium]|nr:LysE family translocator [Woeseiaceae bacterium]